MKVFDWLRLFDKTAFFIRLIQETVISIRSFLMILVLCYLMFGSAFYIININLGPDEEIMPKLSNFWVFNAFESQYELSLGEYMVEDYRESETHQFLIYALFVLSSFIIQITFLNMLIAIMGDTFDRATEERENNARETKLQIMGDYVHLILKDEDEKVEEVPEEKPNSSFLPSASIMLNSTFITEPSQIQEEDKEEKVLDDLLYVV